jgi:hypothetical protein
MSWGERWGSNPRHSGPQPDALPAELRPPHYTKDNRAVFLITVTGVIILDLYRFCKVTTWDVL